MKTQEKMDASLQNSSHGSINFQKSAFLDVTVADNCCTVTEKETVSALHVFHCQREYQSDAILA